MVICLGWYSRAKKRIRRNVRGRPNYWSPTRPNWPERHRKAHDHPWARKYRKRMTQAPYGYPVRYPKKVRRFNKKHQVAGWTPDYWVSPIDFVPGGVYYSKLKKGKKVAKYGRRKARAAVATVKGGYNSRRQGRNSSSSTGRRRRGTYYYYRGKRIYRK